MTTYENMLSVVVVTLNEAHRLPSLYQSLTTLSGTNRCPVEIILVDGGSTDETLTRAKELGFSNVIEVPGASIPVCRNRGAAEAKGRWLAYIDGDCEVASDWLEQALKFLYDAKHTVVGWPATPPKPWTWIQSAWIAHWSNKNKRFEEVDGVSVVRSQAFRLITTRNMLMTRDTFDALDGFDEELPTGEDTDFVFRAHNKGFTVLGLPTLHVTHHGEPRTLRDFFRQQLWHANRKSYQRIAKEQGGRVGGNAPLFTALFLVALIMLSVGVLGMLFCTAVPWYWHLPLLLPLAALLAIPAIIMAARSGRMSLAPSLAVLYFAYGLARSIDLVGLARIKKSWKAST